MGFAQWAGVLDAVGGLVQLGRRFARGSAPDTTSLFAPGASPIGLEARLAGVVVAALKEAFDRDSARLELERSHIEAERRRAEQALRAELRRQAADRALGQLRLLAVMTIGTWALSAALGAWMPGMRDSVPRLLLGSGWAFAFAALGCAFAGWQRIAAWSAGTAETSAEVPSPFVVAAAPWLLLAALAFTAASLLTAL
jgi:hypothetical protein